MSERDKSIHPSTFHSFQLIHSLHCCSLPSSCFQSWKSYLKCSDVCMILQREKKRVNSNICRCARWRNFHKRKFYSYIILGEAHTSGLLAVSLKLKMSKVSLRDPYLCRRGSHQFSLRTCACFVIKIFFRPPHFLLEKHQSRWHILHFSLSKSFSMDDLKGWRESSNSLNKQKDYENSLLLALFCSE